MSSTTDADAASANVETVQAIYEAFGRGDVPAILERLADDVRWEEWADSFAQRAGVPELLRRDGRAGVAEFFGVVGTLDVTEFAVLDLLASERQVAVEVTIAAAHPDGGRFRDEELHLWSFDAAGKVCRMRHYGDTAKHIAAAAGEDTTI